MILKVKILVFTCFVVNTAGYIIDYGPVVKATKGKFHSTYTPTKLRVQLKIIQNKFLFDSFCLPMIRIYFDARQRAFRHFRRVLTLTDNKFLSIFPPHRSHLATAENSSEQRQL